VKKKLNISLLNKIFLERKNIKKIILLQKNLRCFLAKLRIRKKIIINYIKQKRKKAIQLIINKMKSYKNVLKMKKIYFIKNKIEERNKNAKYIQEKFRNYRFYNSFKKFKKEINEKYCIIYPCKGEKVELIIYLEDQNSDLDSKKYAFNYNKLLNCFVLFINPDDLYAGQYKCQFIIDDIIICDKNYPYIQYKNELYNIIEFKTNKRIKEKKRKKKKDKKKANNNQINEKNNIIEEKNIMDTLNKISGNNSNKIEEEENDNDECQDFEKIELKENQIGDFTEITISSLSSKKSSQENKIKDQNNLLLSLYQELNSSNKKNPLLSKTCISLGRNDSSKYELVKLMSVLKSTKLSSWKDNFKSFMSTIYYNGYAIAKKFDKYNPDIPIYIFDRKIENVVKPEINFFLKTFLYMSYRSGLVNLNSIGGGILHQIVDGDVC
jgi:hypothetical protein